MRLLLVLALALAPRAAEACMVESPGWFEVDAASDDAVPPDPPGALASARVNRGVGPECHENGSISSTSCDDLGSFHLYFPAASDDGAPAPDPGVDRVQQGVGYSLRLVSGTPPDSLAFDAETLLAAFAEADVGAHLQILWNDGGTDAQEAFDLTLGVTAVDRAGNRSAEVLFEVSDPGREDPDGLAGCPEPETSAVCATSPAAGALGVLLAAAASAGRRRRPHR